MRVVCHTNLDVIEEWPTELPCRPMVGDMIASLRNGKRVFELKVVRCVFPNARSDHQSGYVDYMEVELHLPEGRWESLNDFIKWYREHR